MAKKELLREEINNEYKWDLTTIYINVEEFNKDYELAQKLIKNTNLYLYFLFYDHCIPERKETIFFFYSMLISI